MNSNYFKSERTIRRLFLLPALIVITLVLIVPLAYCVRNSFFAINLSKMYEPERFVGFGNYIKAFQDPYFLNAVLVSVSILLVAVTLEITLGFLLALFLNKPLEKKPPLVQKMFRTLVILPVVLPPVVVGLMWRFIFQYTGFANYAITLFGGSPVDWSTQFTGLATVIITTVWQNIPFSFLLLLAGLQSIPGDIIDSAMVDGAGSLRRIFSIYLPQLKSVLFVALTIRTVDIIRLFDEVYILTGGGPGRATETISLFVYMNSFSYFNIGYGSALSTILFLILLCISVFYLKILNKED